MFGYVYDDIVYVVVVYFYVLVCILLFGMVFNLCVEYGGYGLGGVSCLCVSVDWDCFV